MFFNPSRLKVASCSIVSFLLDYEDTMLRSLTMTTNSTTTRQVNILPCLSNLLRAFQKWKFQMYLFKIICWDGDQFSIFKKIQNRGELLRTIKSIFQNISSFQSFLFKQNFTQTVWILPIIGSAGLTEPFNAYSRVWNRPCPWNKFSFTLKSYRIKI